MSTPHTETEDHGWTIEIGDHPGRTDSPLYKRSRECMVKAVQAVQPWFFGDKPYQDHHGGGIWLRDAKGWFLVKNLAGVEWSAQFAGAIKKFEALRVNAERLVVGFPLTEKAYVEELGMTHDDLAILHTPITDTDGIAAWTDSFWNASVPLPAGFHTGVIGANDPQQGGVHHYPTPITDIQFIKQDAFALWVQSGSSRLALAPAAFGSQKVRVLHVATDTALMALGAPRGPQPQEGDVLDEDHPLAKAYFIHEEH